MRLEPFEAALGLLLEALTRRDRLAIEDFEEASATKRLLARYLVPSGDLWHGAVYLYPPPKVWRRQAPPEAERLAQSLGPKVQLTGANVVSSFLRERVLDDAFIAALLGFFVVGLLLFLDYRRLGDTLLTLAPLLVGILWMLGGMAILDLSMNFMNIFVSTMIIGIGVDYGVHTIHRYTELQEADDQVLFSGLINTGKAIVLAALSTIIGFGSLSLSHYPGLRSMGLVAILGAVSTALVAITVLPAYLALRQRRRRSSQRI